MAQSDVAALLSEYKELVLRYTSLSCAVASQAAVAESSAVAAAAVEAATWKPTSRLAPLLAGSAAAALAPPVRDIPPFAVEPVLHLAPPSLAELPPLGGGDSAQTPALASTGTEADYRPAEELEGELKGELVGEQFIQGAVQARDQQMYHKPRDRQGDEQGDSVFHTELRSTPTSSTASPVAPASLAGVAAEGGMVKRCTRVPRVTPLRRKKSSMSRALSQRLTRMRSWPRSRLSCRRRVVTSRRPPPAGALTLLGRCLWWVSLWERAVWSPLGLGRGNLRVGRCQMGTRGGDAPHQCPGQHVGSRSRRRRRLPPASESATGACIHYLEPVGEGCQIFANARVYKLSVL